MIKPVPKLPKVKLSMCPDCDGTGINPESPPIGDEEDWTPEDDCKTCDGKGSVQIIRNN